MSYNYPNYKAAHIFSLFVKYRQYSMGSSLFHPTSLFAVIIGWVGKAEFCIGGEWLNGC